MGIVQEVVADDAFVQTLLDFDPDQLQVAAWKNLRKHFLENKQWNTHTHAFHTRSEVVADHIKVWVEAQVSHIEDNSMRRQMQETRQCIKDIEVKMEQVGERLHKAAQPTKVLGRGALGVAVFMGSVPTHRPWKNPDPEVAIEARNKILHAVSRNGASDTRSVAIPLKTECDFQKGLVNVEYTVVKGNAYTSDVNVQRGSYDVHNAVVVEINAVEVNAQSGGNAN